MLFSQVEIERTYFAFNSHHALLNLFSKEASYISRYMCVLSLSRDLSFLTITSHRVSAHTLIPI